MLSKTLKTTLLSLLILMSCQTAWAEVYLNAGIGVGVSTFDDVDPSAATQLSLGYRFGDSPISIEASYVDLGSMDIDTVARGEFDISGYQLTGAWNFFGPEQTWNVYAKAGYFDLETDLEYPDGPFYYVGCPSRDCSADSSGVIVGGGGYFNFAEHLGLYAEINFYPNVDYILDDKEPTYLISTGLRARF